MLTMSEYRDIMSKLKELQDGQIALDKTISNHIAIEEAQDKRRLHWAPRIAALAACVASLAAVWNAFHH